MKDSLIEIIKDRLGMVRGFKAAGYLVCDKCGREVPIVKGVYAVDRACKCGCKEKKVLPLEENDRYVESVLDELARAYKIEIHEYLTPLMEANKNRKTCEAEVAIRAHVKTILTEILPFIDRKLAAKKELFNSLRGVKFEDRTEFTLPSMEAADKAFKEYSALRKRFMALAAYRHFETFCLYVDEYFDYKIFKPSLHLFKGFYYYANSMVLNDDIKFISKQCFTGAGKSVTDCALIAFILGFDINNDILKVFGARDNIGRCIDTVVQIMTSPQYSDIFPYFVKFGGNKSAMFDTCKTSGELKISGSVKSVNLTVRSKEMEFDGIRAMFLFLDDITLSSDAEKIAAHEKDITTYTNRWFQRKYDSYNFRVVASGTTYHVQDILSYLRAAFGAEDEQPTKFPFTTTSKSDEIIPDGKSVFVKIYGLDENDHSTFPEKYPDEQFKKLREKDYRSFMAMTQQEPQPPEGSPFDYSNLPHLYSSIPHVDRENEICYAHLDSARLGKDFQSMPICVKINDNWYLQDCIFEQSPTDKVLPKVIDKIIQHKITHLSVENNIDASLKTMILKLLHERGITWCEVTEKFNYKKKTDKILDNETAVKSIYYPAAGAYGKSSPMGKFMYWLTAYNYDHPPLHDDSVDSLADFCEKFIVGKTSSKAKILSRRRFRN